MAKSPLAPTTIRLPEELMEKIDARATYFKRSRAQEIHFLLESFFKGEGCSSAPASPTTSAEQ